MIGSLLALTCSMLLGVACASPLVDKSFNRVPVQNSLPWMPADYFVSDSSGVTCNFSQFTGIANVVVNGYSFSDTDGNIYKLYGIDDSGISVVDAQSQPYSYTQVTSYLNGYYGGFVCEFGQDLDDVMITPYWTPYAINNYYNYSFWCYVQEDGNNISEVYLYSGINYIVAHADTEISFDSNVEVFSHNFVPSLYGGNISIYIIFNGHDLYQYAQFAFCFGVRDQSMLTYVDGLNTGYDKGYTKGYDDGYLVGVHDGDLSGYARGLQDGLASAQNGSFQTLFGAIADTPIVFLRGLFNFDLFGMNVFVIIMSLLTGILVIYVVKKVVK